MGSGLGEGVAGHVANFGGGSRRLTPHLTSPLKETPAKCPISADPPIGLYLVGTRAYAPDLPFCNGLLEGGRDQQGGD